MLTPEQQAIRSEGIGASEIAAVCGLSPWQGPIDVYLQKTGQATKEETDKTAWGTLVELMVKRWYCYNFKCELQNGATTRHAEHPWAIATPDFILDGKLIEVKNVGMRVAHHWGGGVPDYVVCQVLWQMLVTGYREAEVVATIGGLPPEVFPVAWDEEQAMLMFSVAELFWHNRVLAKVPPEPDGSNSYKEFLSRRYPRSGPGLAKCRDGEEQWAIAYEEAARLEKEAKSRKDEAANRLRAAIGEHEGLIFDGGKVTWKSDKNGSRTLRVTWKGSK